jgi:hypothetical protein
MKIKALFAASALATMLAAGMAHANATSGSLWINNPNPDNADIIPPGPADATFNPGVINYQSDSSYTIGQFLNNPVFSNESAAFITAGEGGASADNLFLLITGTLGLVSGNNSFIVGHDDGAVVTLGGGFGTVLDAPGPTSFSTSPFNVFNPGPAENVTFSLQYTECCGPPADLEFAVNNVIVTGGVPEPATWAMMLVGFGGLGATLRRRRAQMALAAA